MVDIATGCAGPPSKISVCRASMTCSNTAPSFVYDHRSALSGWTSPRTAHAAQALKEERRVQEEARTIKAYLTLHHAHANPVLLRAPTGMSRSRTAGAHPWRIPCDSRSSLLCTHVFRLDSPPLPCALPRMPSKLPASPAVLESG
jgi:hypothetical protein